MTLIGYWPLNESSGTTAYDHSVNENHGTVKDGGDSTLPGATGLLGQNSYSFDGKNDYVEISDKDIFDVPSITVVLWFWLEPGALDFSGPVRSMIARDDNQEERAWKIGVNDEGMYHAELNADTRNVIEPSKTVETGVWIQVALSYDGNNAKLFQAGKLIAKASNSGDAASVNQSISIGAPAELEDNRYFSGKISEVRIYDRPLTKSEVQYLHSVGKRGLQTTGKKSS